MLINRADQIMRYSERECSYCFTNLFQWKSRLNFTMTKCITNIDENLHQAGIFQIHIRTVLNRLKLLWQLVFNMGTNIIEIRH